MTLARLSDSMGNVQSIHTKQWRGASSVWRISKGPWGCIKQRWLQEMYLNALQLLAQRYTHQGDYEQALAYGRQILAKDPLLEEVHRQMLSYCDQLGDHTGVIRQYRQLETILADQLEIEPMPATQALYQTLIGKVTV